MFGQEKATQQQVNQAEDLSTVFRDVGKRVETSVVNIEVHKTIKAPQSVPLPDDMLRRFFPNGVPQQQQPDGGDDEQRRITVVAPVVAATSRSAPAAASSWKSTARPATS